MVDNACPDDSSEAVADLPGRGSSTSPRNGGFAYGCNLGAAAGSAEFVLLLNPDARARRRRPRARSWTRCAPIRALGAVGPRTVDERARCLFTPAALPAAALDLRAGAVPAPRWRRSPPGRTTRSATRRPTSGPARRSGSPAAACCSAARRSSPVGGLDEGFFLYSEETDLFRRLAAAGWRVGYEPRAAASHVGQGSASADTTEPFRAHSRVRYARKHHGAVVALARGARARARQRSRTPRRGSPPRPRPRAPRRRPRRAARHPHRRRHA